MTAALPRFVLVLGVLLAGRIVSPARADDVSEGIARAAAVVADHTDVPRFVPPGEAFDIRACAKGKKMLSIPNSSTNQFLKGVIAREIAVGNEIGLKVMEWQNQGQPNDWAQGVNYATANKFDIVDLISGINPAVLEPQIAAAKAAGVKTFLSHYLDPTQPAIPLLEGNLPFDFVAMGNLLADWAITSTKGAANVVIIKSGEIVNAAAIVQGIRDTLVKNCPNCKIVQEINVGTLEWGTKIQPSVQSTLLAHPEVNFIVPIYDSMSQFITPAVQITGRSASVKIATANGTPFVLDLIRQGKVDMDLGESLDWIARATIDGYMRKTCGLKMPAMIGVPLYIFAKSNVANAGLPAVADQGYGDDYVKGFNAVWKLN